MSDVRLARLPALLLGACLSALSGLPARSEEAGFECLIEPSSVIEVASPTMGVLDEVLVDRGDRVEENQLLARLQSDVERVTVDLAERRVRLDAAINAAIARIDFEKLELARSRELRKQDHVSESELEEAEMEARLAELRLEELQENRELAQIELERTRELLEMKRIRSRSDALVVERFKNPGEYVEDEPILRLAVVSPLYVEVVLPVEMLGSVEAGGTASVLPEQPVGGEFAATIKVVDEVVDSATSTFRVRLELPNRERQLPAGLRCVVRFDPLPDRGEDAEGLATAPEGAEREEPDTSQHGG